MTKWVLSLLTASFVALPASRGQTPGPPSDAPVIITPAKVEILHPGEGYPDDTPAPGQPIEGEHEGAGPLRFWFRGEYLLWFTKDARFPPLVTGGITTDPLPGVIGQSGTSVLYGGKIDYQDRNGGRFALGYFFNNKNTLSLEGSYLFLGTRQFDVSFTSPSTSPGPLVIARPFFNAVTKGEDASLVGYPGVISGTVTVSTSNFFQGAEANLSFNLWRGAKARLDGLAGFRYWGLEEGLGIFENTTVSPTSPVFAGNNIRVNDLFTTNNNFYGAQIGMRGIVQWKRLDFEFLAKLALGYTQDILNVRGSTFIDTNPITQVNSGLLALSSNSGRFSHSEFTAIPEANVNLAWNITDHLKLVFGYTFVIWDGVLRPGEQIDRTINPNLISTSATFNTAGGPARPAPLLRTSDFWAQGFNFGIELRY
ncbi:MAG: BBP7 family outer membrane beta-barrel protein [Planctomycetes bacterium]|nr:BBP7 family outer membrane beta-barrel protein [Planctomycetota bacterium]